MAVLHSLIVAAVFMSTVTAAPPTGHVKKVVVLMMENHSFDNMMGWLKRNNSDINGLTGAEYNLVNPQDPSSAKVFVTDRGAYRDPDPDHSVEGTALGIFGRKDIGPIEHDPSAVTMGGFVKAYENVTQDYSIMDAMRPDHVPVISTLAMEFALFDAFHAAVPGPTFPNRLFAQSGTSHGFGTNDAIQTIEGWPQRSLYSAINASGSSWGVYFEDVATAWLLNDTRTEFGLSQSKLMSEFAADAASGALPDFSFLEPSYFTIDGVMNASDQHPDHDVAVGEQRIKWVYEALRASPLWNETALVVTYDEHGGFYDHVATPVLGVPSPDGLPCHDCKVAFNFTRAGVRIPFVVVSPWVAKGTVVHFPSPAHQPTNTSIYDLASIPATMHGLLATNSFLTARDAWSSPFSHVWEESGLTEPRTDCPTTLPEPPVTMPVWVGNSRVPGSGPINHLQQSLLQLVHGLAGMASTPEQSAAILAGRNITTEGAAGLHARAVLQAHFASKGLRL